MGFFDKLADGIKDAAEQFQEDREKQRQFVAENPGSQAICNFCRALFQPDNPAYDWLKDTNEHVLLKFNKVGLFPKVHEDHIAICRRRVAKWDNEGGGRASNLDEAIHQTIEVQTYTFAEMYEWDHADPDTCYAELDSRLMQSCLFDMIRDTLDELPHLENNNGEYLLR